MPERKEEEKDRERGKRDGGRCHHGSTISTPTGVCPPSIRPLSPTVPVNFLKATRSARAVIIHAVSGHPSTAGADVRVGIRLPFAARTRTREAGIGEEAGTGTNRRATAGVYTERTSSRNLAECVIQPAGCEIASRRLFITLLA